MQGGQRVGGRWELLTPVVSGADLERWRAADADSGEPVEVLRPRSGSLDPAFRRLVEAADPALARVIAVVDDGGLMLVREPLEHRDGRALEGPLDPDVVAAIGARLFPAVLAASPALGGVFRPDDVGFRADGAPVVAPRPRAKASVSARDTRYVAAELRDGRAPDAAAALFGLGVWLYQLATGVDPEPVPATPSAVRRGVPPALDRALLQLLSRDPTTRAAAQASLTPGPIPDLRQITAALAPVRVTVGAEGPRSRATVEADAGAWPVVLAPRELAALSPEQRSLAAGFAEVPLSALDELVSASLPLVLYSGRSKQEADAKAVELAAALRAPVAPVSAVGCLPWLLALAAVSGLPVALVVALVAGPLAGAFAVALLVFIAVLGGWMGVSRVRASRLAARGRTALQLGARDPVTAAIHRRIASFRRRLASADVPGAVAVDLRSSLAEVERHIDGLQEVRRIAEEALTRTDPGQLRARRDVIPASQAAERDRLSRAIADLEAVQARRDRAVDEIARVEASLDELDAVFGRVAAGVEIVDVAGRMSQLAKLVGSIDVDPERS
jgi:hypothetical protein